MKSLYQRCFEASAYQDTIRFSHLPFENGYYVTEANVILMVEKPLVYVLENNTWINDQYFFSLWYDDMKDFADIPPEIVEELQLKEKLKSFQSGT